MIVLWNTLYINAALEQLAREGHHVTSEDVARLSPLVLAGTAALLCFALGFLFFTTGATPKSASPNLRRLSGEHAFLDC